MENEIATIEEAEEETITERRKSPKGKRAWQNAELEYVRLRQAGESIQAVSDTLSVLESQCIQWEQAHRKEINQSRFLLTEQICNDKGLTRVSRIETMSKILDKINSEIDKRDFSDIPTDKLILLGAKMSEFIKTEIESSSIDVNKPFSLGLGSTEKMSLE
mgnify:CR=1 FL=1